MPGCKPGKHPIAHLVRHGCKDATLDRTTIESWWRQRLLANVAIATGGSARLLVIDIDPDAGGETSIRTLETKHGPLPATVEVITPRGGRHLYLFVPAGRPLPTISAGQLGNGVDMRCQGGYVLAPPSANAGRAYSWSVDSADRIGDAPEWLLDLLANRGGNGGPTPPEEWLALVTQDIEEGERNSSIARIAGLLLRRLPDPEIAASLCACFNQVRCKPPLEADELKRTLDSIADREMQRRGL